MKLYCKRAWAEVYLDRLERNLEAIKKTLNPKTEIMAVIKADAYGHGEGEICYKLANIGVKYFAVSNLDEAISVRRHCPMSDILILGYTPEEYVKKLSYNNIIQGIVSYEHAYMLSKNAKNNIRCHIKIDTGMGRIGLKYSTPNECANCIEEIIKLPNLLIEGIYTHFSVADSDLSDDVEYTKNQIEFITTTYDMLINKGYDIKHLHFLNSAGSAYHYDDRSTLARIGISMYGLLPNSNLPLPYEVEPVMEFKAIISEVKTIHKGDFVSYGRTYCATDDTTIATVAVGYADGYSRQLSSRADVLLRGTRCKIVGRVCMDQLIIDVSHLRNVKPNEIVTLFGKDGDESITADELANIYGTIGYEIICGISKRVPRKYL